MKVLYLAEWDAYSNSGVIRKIKAQFETWRGMGVDARLVVVSPEGAAGASPLISGDGITVVTHRTGRRGLGKLFKAIAIRAAKRVVEDFAPDVIYYRQSSWTPGILTLLDKAPCLIVEVNSNDVHEIHQYGRLKARYHLATRTGLIKRVAGFVCVGNELGEFYRQYGKPVAVVGNGFDTSSVEPRLPPGNSRPQLVFVGSAGQAWHGVDKIMQMAEALPEFDFHIVGDDFPVSHPNVKCHGHVDWRRLDQLYRKMDIGIASLALHRININEISPLKTREYLAYGLPIIAAYEDPDLDGCPFFLRLPNREDGVRVSTAAIREFVAEWIGREIDSDWVRERIDSCVKEQKRIEFFYELAR